MPVERGELGFSPVKKKKDNCISAYGVPSQIAMTSFGARVTS